MTTAGFASPYSVSVFPGTGPLLLISAEDNDPAAALATRDEVIKRIEAKLAQIQSEENVPDSQLIVARQFQVSSRAEVLAGNKLRALAGIAVLGTVLTVLVVFWNDRRVSRRPRPLLSEQPTPAAHHRGATGTFVDGVVSDQSPVESTAEDWQQAAESTEPLGP